MYQMIYPQKPLVSTDTLDLVHFDELPSGQNASIAIMSFSGYDIEDALVISKASIERGFGRALQSKKEVIEFQRGITGQGDILLPEKKSDGIAMINQQLRAGDILVNRHSMVNSTQAEPRPVRYKGKTTSYVSQVQLTSSGENYLMIKVQLSQMKIPEIGDKFSSRHGQKGVLGIKIS